MHSREGATHQERKKMIELGKRQLLEVVRIKDFGVYLGEQPGDEAAVLLPKKQVPQGPKQEQDQKSSSIKIRKTV